MKGYTDYIRYLIFELIAISIMIYYFSFTSATGVFLTIYFVLSPWLLYIQHKGLGFLEAKLEDTGLYNIRNVLDRTKKSSKLDRIYFITYLTFILFGVLLMFFGTG
jgi:predicted nucleic acid-binding Zn ribbon protein